MGKQTKKMPAGLAEGLLHAIQIDRPGQTPTFIYAHIQIQLPGWVVIYMQSISAELFTLLPWRRLRIMDDSASAPAPAPLSHMPTHH